MKSSFTIKDKLRDMQIAFLTMGKDIGGAAQDVITLSQGLHKRGHNVFVISSAGVMDKELRDTGVIFIDAPLYTRNPLGLWFVSRKIRRIILDNKIEILNPQGMYTAMASWLASFGFGSLNFKIITTIHMISSLKLYKYTWVLNLLSKHIVTESNCERNRLIGGGVKKKKITVIPNSVDMDRFSRIKSKPVLRDEYGLKSSTLCFGIIARLSPEKCHLDFVEAAKITHREYNDSKFFIVGDGPMRPRILNAIQGVEDFIIMTGMRRDIPNVLSSLDCFVLSSEVESLPLSIREAMSMSLPVITTDVGGVREAVLEGITGLVVPRHNPEALAQAMIKIAKDSDIRILLGFRGRELCKLNFELHNWSSKTEDLFTKISNEN